MPRIGVGEAGMAQREASPGAPPVLPHCPASLAGGMDVPAGRQESRPRVLVPTLDGRGGSGSRTGWEVDDAAAMGLDPASAAGLLVRPLGRADLPGVERHFLAFDLADRRARFGTALRDAAISAYVRGLDPSRAVLVGAVDGSSGRVVGLAEAQPTGAPRRVEMAVSVEARHRRRGLGRHLLVQTMAIAFTRGAEAAEFLFAPDNRAVAGLVRALGARTAATLDRAEMRPA
jgi:ribosomal protein S18 acetylase RimI-like enzyme